MLLDGLVRLDEMELYRIKIASSDAVPHAVKNAPRDGLTPEMQQLFALVDGRRTLAELAAATALGEFEATKAAYKLLEQGYLRL